MFCRNQALGVEQSTACSTGDGFGREAGTSVSLHAHFSANTAVRVGMPDKSPEWSTIN